MSPEVWTHGAWGCQWHRESKPLPPLPETRFQTKFCQFGWFPDPSDQNELYHTPSYPKIWDFTKEKKIVNYPFNRNNNKSYFSVLWTSHCFELYRRCSMHLLQVDWFICFLLRRIFFGSFTISWFSQTVLKSIVLVSFTGILAISKQQQTATEIWEHAIANTTFQEMQSQKEFIIEGADFF